MYKRRIQNQTVTRAP